MICKLREVAKVFSESNKFQPETLLVVVESLVASVTPVAFGDTNVVVDELVCCCVIDKYSRIANDASSACLLLALCRISETNILAIVNVNGSRSGNLSMDCGGAGRGELG